jgi:hypothetical protein
VGPKDLLAPDAALAAAKEAKKPLALVFLQEDELRSRLFLMALAGPAVGAETLDKVVLARVPFDKDAEDAKRWKVTAPGVMAILDVSGDEPRLLKLSKVPDARAIRRDLDAALKPK